MSRDELTLSVAQSQSGKWLAQVRRDEFGEPAALRSGVRKIQPGRDAAFEHGEMVGQRTFEIPPGEALDAFLRRSKTVAAELLLDVLEEVEQSTVSRTPLAEQAQRPVALHGGTPRRCSSACGPQRFADESRRATPRSRPSLALASTLR